MIRIRTMTAGDLSFGMRLKQQAGWNQTEADWRRFLHLQPDGCFVAELDHEPAGTAAAFVFGSVAWIAMVLVDESRRGRGIGTALMKHALDFLDERGVRSVRLDATPLGRPIYEKLGFAPQFQLTRYAGTLPAGAPAPSVEPARPEDLDTIVQLDRAITCADRRRLLTSLFAERPDAMRVVRKGQTLAGFLTSRPGARAVQIGPCLAAPDAGPLLVADAFCRHAGQQVFLDVPTTHGAAAPLAEAQGLTAQRHLLRMCRGELIQEPLHSLWAGSGPEKG